MEIYRPGMKGYDPNVDDTKSLEEYLEIPKDSLKNIPVYARTESLSAIRNVMKLESEKHFRRGIYYIVLTDLCKNTAFQKKYGNDLTDIRVQWFHTAVIRALGEIQLDNYANFNKTIGDASLLIFSSFHDVIKWSNQLQHSFVRLKESFQETISDSDSIISSLIYDDEKEDDDAIDNIVNDFDLKARRLVHIGEVSYSDNTDPLALAVSQTFKTEKVFSSYEYLGCTQIVANIVPPLLRGLGLKLVENVETQIVGEENRSMTYYLVKK